MTTLPAISDLIPQRGRWQVLDRVVSVDLDTHTLVAETDFTLEHAEGHFPGMPVVPGVLLLEGLAQAMLALSSLAFPDQTGTPFLVGFDKVRFRTPVVPPATVRFEVRADLERAGLHTAKGSARIGGKRAATAQLIGTVIPAAE